MSGSSPTNDADWLCEVTVLPAPVMINGADELCIVLRRSLMSAGRGGRGGGRGEVGSLSSCSSSSMFRDL